MANIATASYPLLTTAAADRQDNGTYRVRGDKLWISGGDYELAENIVDLAGLNHKMGWRGTVNTALARGSGANPAGREGGAVGYLIGEEGRGLSYMFLMMNEARLGIGYTRDYPVEQFYRDNRLNPIHEGTHGIHGIHPLGRKVHLGDGAGFDELLRRVRDTVERASAAGQQGPTADLAAQLDPRVDRLAEVTEIARTAASFFLDHLLPRADVQLDRVASGCRDLLDLDENLI